MHEIDSIWVENTIRITNLARDGNRHKKNNNPNQNGVIFTTHSVNILIHQIITLL